jgi:hypothetical protein
MTLVSAAGLTGTTFVVDQCGNAVGREKLTNLAERLASVSACAMNKDHGRNRSFAVRQKQASGKFDGLVVKLDRVLLKSGFRARFLSTGYRFAYPYRKHDERQRGRQHRDTIDVRHA